MWQDGVNAPPEEERLKGVSLEDADLGDFDPDLAGDSDLSFATMFANSLGADQGEDRDSRGPQPGPTLGALASVPAPEPVPGLLDGACVRAHQAPHLGQAVSTLKNEWFRQLSSI